MQLSATMCALTEARTVEHPPIRSLSDRTRKRAGDRCLNVRGVADRALRFIGCCGRVRGDKLDPSPAVSAFWAAAGAASVDGRACPRSVLAPALLWSAVLLLGPDCTPAPCSCARCRCCSSDRCRLSVLGDALDSLDASPRLLDRSRSPACGPTR
mgnify:CR=1 FL=1